MNIVISLDCSPEQAEFVLDGIKGVLSAQGLEANSFGVGGITALHCFPQVEAEPAFTKELPAWPMGEPTDEPMGDPVGIPPAEVAFVPEPPPEVSVSPTGIVAMVNMSPMGDAPEVPAELPAEPFVEPEKVPAPVFGDVRILTLSTSYFIPSTVVPVQNTVLKVMGLTVSEGIVRFTYNGFDHVLPVAETTDSIIANNSHTSGPTTVRLVIDIANKNCPCLVDLEGGDREELLIGDDLIPAIVEAVENVPAE